MIAGVSTAVGLLNAGSARLGTCTAMASPGVIFNIAVLLSAMLTSISPTQIRDDTPTVPVSPQTSIMRDLGNSSHTDKDIHRCAQPDVKSPRFRHLAAILNSLKELDILDINDPRCFALEEIRASVSDSEGLIQVNLALLVREEQRNVAGDTGYADIPVEPPEEMKCIDIIMNAPKGGNVARATAIPITTSSARDGQLTGDTISNEGDDSEGGLNKTQIMTIATCSTVIGLFFFVALGMRIRNYLKRMRSSSMERWPSIRSTGFPNKTSSGGDNGYRDSGLPIYKGEKTSDDGEGAIGDVTTRPPPIIVIDDKPLLVVTSASTPSSPTLDHSSGYGCYAATTAKKITPEEEHEECPLLPSSDKPAHNKALYKTNGGSFRKEEKDAESDKTSAFLPKWMSELQTKLQQIDGQRELRDNYSLDEYGNYQSHGPPLLSLVHTAGITQSDSSIESGNPSYKYGNQVEYSANDDVNDVPATGEHQGSRRPSIELEELPEPIEYSAATPSSYSCPTSDNNSADDNVFVFPPDIEVEPLGLPSVPQPCLFPYINPHSSCPVGDFSNNPTAQKVNESDSDICGYSEAAGCVAATRVNVEDRRHNEPDAGALTNKKAVSFSVADQNNSSRDETIGNSKPGSANSGFLSGPEFEGMEPTFV